MRAVVQRVREAAVDSYPLNGLDNKERTGEIDRGLLVFLAVHREDDERDVQYTANKIAGLRVFPDHEKPLNRSVVEAGGKILLISQFTLYGDTRKGMRPSFNQASPPEKADVLYQGVAAKLREQGLTVETGAFQTTMEVSLINEGPVTVLIDSNKQF